MYPRPRPRRRSSFRRQHRGRRRGVLRSSALGRARRQGVAHRRRPTPRAPASGLAGIEREMIRFSEVDALEILVLVDNVTDSLSTNPPDVLPEWSVLLTGGKLRVLAGSATCCAHHGF